MEERTHAVIEPNETCGGDFSTEDGPGVLEIDYLADAPEQSLKAAADAAERKGEPLKIRTLLQLFHSDQGRYGTYKGWRGQAWGITVKGIEDARRFQQVLETVFDLIWTVGAERLLQELGTIKDRTRDRVA